MKYYLIVNGASGDLHVSYLMMVLKVEGPQVNLRFPGEDLMAAVEGTTVKYYKELAYMGSVPVLPHLCTIFINMKRCEKDIVVRSPDVVILVDYSGLNPNIARSVHSETQIPVFYYISLKIWVRKEYHIKNIKRDVNELFFILPFEVEFYTLKHRYPIHYVGDPTVDKVTAYQKVHPKDLGAFLADNGLEDKLIIALLAGSRKQETEDNLPNTSKVASVFPDHRLVLAGAPGITPEYYKQYVGQAEVRITFAQIHRLLQHAEMALATSGMATLEIVLFRVPQVVCYYTPIGKVVSFLHRHILRVKFISLVNLIADREVARGLAVDTMTAGSIQNELKRPIENQEYKNRVFVGYEYIADRSGPAGVPRHTIHRILELPKK